MSESEITSPEATHRLKIGNKEYEFLDIPQPSRVRAYGFEPGVHYGPWNMKPDAHSALINCWVESHVPAKEIMAINTLAMDVLDDKEKALNWLTQPNLATDNRPPIELIGEEGGYDRVKNLLLRIECGALA